MKAEERESRRSQVGRTWQLFSLLLTGGATNGTISRGVDIMLHEQVSLRGQQRAALIKEVIRSGSGLRVQGAGRRLHGSGFAS